MRTDLARLLMSGSFALATLSCLAQSAAAATFHNGWQYARDSPNDSLAATNGQRIAGGTVFEILSMAIKDDPLTNSVWVALNANLPLFGTNTGPEICITGERCYPVADSNIGWGDLFFDFSGTGNLKTASDSGQLYGIRFSPTNDSGVPSVGLYSGVRATSVTRENAGYSNLWNNNNMLEIGLGRPKADMGDLTWNDPYFAPYTSQGFYSQPDSLMPNVIGTGTKIAEIILLDRNALTQAGFEPAFSSSVGSEVFGFRVAKEALPVGNFIATVLTECVNDGIALASELAAALPPPPPTVCPLDPDQLNPVQPTQVINGSKYFENAASELWYDPSPTMGYQIVVTGDGAITEIQGFPCLVDQGTGTSDFPRPFEISVKDENGKLISLGTKQPGDTLNLKELAKVATGNSTKEVVIKEVIISGVVPDEWPDAPNPQVPFKIRFDRPNVNLIVTEIADTTIPTPPKLINLPQKPEVLPPIDPIDPPVGPTPYPTAAVPEPTAMAGLALAAGGLFGLRRKVGKKK